MFNMYRRRFYRGAGNRGTRDGGGSSEELGHDRFNYMNPNVNYDKWPRRLRPKKNSVTIDLEAPESPHPSEDKTYSSELRDCKGSLREHQRLLNLRSVRHKCSPSCQVKESKSSSPTLSTETLVKVFGCLGMQDATTNSSSTANSTAAGAAGSSYGWNSTAGSSGCDRGGTGYGCHRKRPKRFSILSASLSSLVRYSSRNKEFNTSGSQDTDNNGGFELTELERRARCDGRELATDLCRQYIRSSTRYILLDHLQDIGSRIDKQWFTIRDKLLKTERLLTIIPLSGSPSYGCEVTTSDADATRNALVDLFAALQHPYIYPILDVEFVYGSLASAAVFSDDVKPVLVTVFPFNTKGSLKDLIYRSRWQDDWSHKYRQRSEGLPLLQVQRLGRQILEALLFLQDRGFPPFGHLHSGNVIIQNGVARLTGFENTLLGFSSRAYPLIKSVLHGIPSAIDTICFGHVLFEMCTGYELYAPKPTARHLEDMRSYPQVIEVLDYIFNSPRNEYPSIAKLAILEFFRNIDLREMRCSTIYHNAKLTRAALSLLERAQQKRRRERRETYSKLPTKMDSGSLELSTDASCSYRQVDVHDIDEEEEEDADYEDADDVVYYDDVGGDAGELYEDAMIPHEEGEAASPSSPSISLNYVDGFGFGPGTIDRRTISSRCQTPSMILASLMSLDQMHPADTIVATSAQNDFYCSDESFKTPLESPGGESEYYYNGFNGMKAMNGYVDVSEAFTIHDRMSSQSFDSN